MYGKTSPHIATPSQTEQQRIVDRTPSQGPLSRAQGKVAKKAKGLEKPRIRSKKAANTSAAKEPQTELSRLAKATLDPTPTGSLLQHPGSLLPTPGSMTQSFEPAHLPPVKPSVSQASSLTIARSVPQKSGSVLPALSGPSSHQAPGPAAIQRPGHVQPHHPRSTQPTQDPSSTSAPIQSHNVSTRTYTTPPGRAASIWTESKKEALGANAVRFLSSVPENSGRTITPQQICTILDRNPNYEELCENIETMGFRLDRVRFAKALLAAVPDSDPTASLQTQEPLSANNGKDIAQSYAETAPSAISDRHDQLNTHSHMATSGIAYLTSGTTVAPPLTRISNGETSILADTPARRGRGRPKKNKNAAQARSDMTSQHVKKADGNSVIHGMHSGPSDALDSAGTKHSYQTSLVHGETQRTGQDYGDIRFRSFTPLNGPRVHQEERAANGLVPHQPLHQHVAAAAPKAVKDKSNNSEGNVIDKGLHGSLDGRGRPLKAASLRAAANFPSFLPSPLLTAPTLLMAREPTPPRRASLADIEHLTQDPYDLEPELPDHLGYLERHRSSHSQATATNEPATSKTASMLPSRAGSGTSTPKSTTASALQTRVNGRSARLREAFRANPRLRSRAGKYPAYNPKRIAHDLLVAVGKHPATRPLNAHVERIRTKAARVQRRAKLSAVYWAAVDQGPLHRLPKSANAGTMATEKVGVTSNGPKAIVRAAPQHPLNTKAAAKADNETSTSLTAGNTNSPRHGEGQAGRRSPSPSSSSGAVLTSLGNASTLSDQEAGQENRSSFVRAGRGNGLSGNIEQHGSSTPARPSGLRNEITLSMPPSVVIRSRSPSVLAEYTPFARSRAPFVTPTSPAYDPGPSGYIVFKCEWLSCKAELHNFATLRRHVTIVHRKKVHGVYQCHWRGCGKLVERHRDDGKSGFIENPVDFSHTASWDAHMEECHLAPVRSTLGLGPRAGPIGESPLSNVLQSS
jgi:hypothetical protein